MRKFVVLLAGVLVMTALIVFYFQEKLVATLFFNPRKNFENIQPKVADTDTSAIEVVLTDLAIPWEILYLSENDYVITERSGNLVRYTKNGDQISRIPIQGVHHSGEGGLHLVRMDISTLQQEMQAMKQPLKTHALWRERY